MKYRVREKLKMAAFGVLLLGLIGGLTYTVNYALKRDFNHYEKDREEKSANIKNNNAEKVSDEKNKKDEATNVEEQGKKQEGKVEESKETLPISDDGENKVKDKFPSIVSPESNNNSDDKPSEVDIPEKIEEPVKNVNVVCKLEMSEAGITVSNTILGKANGSTKIFDSLSIELVYDLSSIEEVGEDDINELIVELDNQTMEMDGFKKKINSNLENKKVSIKYVADETFLKTDESKKYDEYVDTLKSDGYSCVLS